MNGFLKTIVRKTDSYWGLELAYYNTHSEKTCDKRRSWPIWRYYPESCTKKLKKTTIFKTAGSLTETETRYPRIGSRRIKHPNATLRTEGGENTAKIFYMCFIHSHVLWIRSVTPIHRSTMNRARHSGVGHKDRIEIVQCFLRSIHFRKAQLTNSP